MAEISKDFRLSETEIKKLFEFAEKKFVHWFDLQIEIVDHLASSIEAEIQSNSNLTFEAALEKVYKSFGIFGFAKIVQERQTQLAKAAKNMWWHELKSLFLWPRIILFLLILFAVRTLSVSVNTEVLSELFLVIYITISLLFLSYTLRDNHLRKRLLLMQYGAVYCSLPFIFEFMVISPFPQMSSLSFTILLTTGIVIKLTSFTLYKRVRGEAEKLYPSVFLK
jgi:hypothetical protein